MQDLPQGTASPQRFSRVRTPAGVSLLLKWSPPLMQRDNIVGLSDKKTTSATAAGFTHHSVLYQQDWDWDFCRESPYLKQNTYVVNT